MIIKRMYSPPGAPGGSAHPALPAYSVSNAPRADGVWSDLLDWIPPSSDLYAQPICHRWSDFSVVDIGNPLRSIDLWKICSLCLILHRSCTSARCRRGVQPPPEAQPDLHGSSLKLKCATLAQKFTTPAAPLKWREGYVHPFSDGVR